MRKLITVISAITLAACHHNPPPPLTAYDSMDKFMGDLANRANSRMGSANDFKVIVTQANFPIGTLLRPESTVPIDYTACLPSVTPSAAGTPSLFPTYEITKGLAMDFGLDNEVIQKLADFKIEIKDFDKINVSVKDPKIQTLSDNEIKKTLLTTECRNSIPAGGAWLIRGYIAGQRNFSLGNENSKNIKGKITKVASFDVNLGSGDSSLEISDSTKTDFLQVISQVTTSPIKNDALVLNIPQASSNPGKIYVQRDRLDTSAAGEAIVASLKSKSFTVATGIERIDTSRMPKTAQVRYFNDSDKSAAEKALAELQKQFPTAILLRVGLPAPSGQLEVWLPRV